MGKASQCGAGHLHFLLDKLGAISLAVAFVLFITSDASAAKTHHPHPPVTSQFQPTKFYNGYVNLWGPQHQEVSEDQSSTTIWLDTTSGSGFKSLKAYKSGFFSAAIKLQSGYTAGVITAFYVMLGF